MESELRQFQDILKDGHAKSAPGPMTPVDAPQYVMVDE